MVSAGVPAEYAQVPRPLTATLVSGNGARPNSDILDVSGTARVAFAEFAAKTAPAWKVAEGKERHHEGAYRQP